MKKEDILNNYVENIKQLGKELIDNAEAIVYDKIPMIREIEIYTKITSGEISTWDLHYSYMSNISKLDSKKTQSKRKT